MTTVNERRDRASVPVHLIAAALALTGAGLIAAGVAVPWFSLFAGLQPVSAMGSTNGTILLVAAAASASIGIAAAVADRPLWRRLLLAAGIGLVAFSAYLVVQLLSTFREVSADPLVVAQLGPGLGLVVIGALAITAASFLGDARASR